MCGSEDLIQYNALYRIGKGGLHRTIPDYFGCLVNERFTVLSPTRSLFLWAKNINAAPWVCISLALQSHALHSRSISQIGCTEYSICCKNFTNLLTHVLTHHTIVCVNFLYLLKSRGNLNDAGLYRSSKHTLNEAVYTNRPNIDRESVTGRLFLWVLPSFGESSEPKLASSVSLNYMLNPLDFETVVIFAAVWLNVIISTKNPSDSPRAAVKKK